MKWEYYVLERSNLVKAGQQERLDSDLDALGADGWELVAVVGDPYRAVKAFMKRPIND